MLSAPATSRSMHALHRYYVVQGYLHVLHGVCISITDCAPSSADRVASSPPMRVLHQPGLTALIDTLRDTRRGSPANSCTARFIMACTWRPAHSKKGSVHVHACNGWHDMVDAQVRCWASCGECSTLMLALQVVLHLHCACVQTSLIVKPRATDLLCAAVMYSQTQATSRHHPSHILPSK